MTGCKVSVVIPIYNVEKYLDRCMESVVRQTYADLEIIMVDDGSPDSCPGKCEEWAQKDSRIKVIHKANAGLGMARNTGIENATGKYICFFDSDDYVAPDTIEHAVALAEQNSSDTVLFGMTEVGPSGEIKGVYFPYTEEICYRGDSVLNFVLPNMIEGSSRKGQGFGLNMSSCTCMFSVELIRRHNWRFVSEREYISEDYYSLLMLYQHVQNVSVLKKACYFYCYNQASLSHVYRADRYARIAHCYRAMAQMCDQLHYPEQIGSCLAIQYLGNVIGAMKTVVADPESSFSEKIKRLREILKDKTLHSAFGRIDLGAESAGRKILICTMKAKCALLVYLQLQAKLLLGREK